MAYTPNVWESRNVQYPNRWTDQNGNVLTLTPSPGTVVAEGTPFNAAWMNHIEEGIQNLPGGTIIGAYFPTTATIGEIGQLYYATQFLSVFICVAAANGIYTWSPLYLDGSVSVHVSPNGSDTTGNGTGSSPFATIQHAIDLCPPSAKARASYAVVVHAGIYPESILISGINTPIAFRGDSGAIISPPSGSTAVSVKDSNAVTFVSMQLTSGETVTGGYGYLINNSSVDLTGNSSTISGFLSAVLVTTNGVCFVYSIAVSNCAELLRAQFGGSAHVQAATGSVIGTPYVADGGIITIGSSSVTGGASSNYSTSLGGRIYSGSQTSVPNY